MDRDAINHRFDYHAPDEDRIKRHEDVRAALRQVAHFINRATPEGREQSLAITKLEEALSWANAAIARGVDDD